MHHYELVRTTGVVIMGRSQTAQAKPDRRGTSTTRTKSLKPTAANTNGAPKTAGPKSDPNWKPRVGDRAVYPGQGVARVAKRQKLEVAGQECDFFVLQLIEDNSRILVPADKLAEVGLRRVMGDEDAKKLWAILKKRSRKGSGGVTWSRQFRNYQDKIKNGSVFEAAEVMRDLLRLQTRKELSFGEHRLLENARMLVVQELAVSQALEAVDVEAEIRSAIT